jgi:hypothetical protein
VANVVRLKEGQSTPEFSERILIVSDASRKTCTTTVWQYHTVVYQSERWTFEEALRHSKTNAASFGVDVIFTQEVGHADL